MKQSLVLAISFLFLVSCEHSSNDTKEHDQNESTKTEVTPTDSAETEIPVPEGWELTKNQEITYLGIIDSINHDNWDSFSEKLGSDYGQIVAYMTANNIEFAGAPLTQWLTWNDTGYSQFAAGIPVANGTLGNENIQTTTIEAGQAFKYVHHGSYESMETAHISINDYFLQTGKDAIGGPWESYITDPGTQPDTTQWVSEIWYPVSGY